MRSVCQAGETSGQDGALYRQHSVQDRRCDREAGSHGEGQSQEERCAGQAAGRSPGGEMQWMSFRFDCSYFKVFVFSVDHKIVGKRGRSPLPKPKICPSLCLYMNY